MFKVGDLIVGLPNSIYGVTKYGVVCKVVQTYIDYIRVRVEKINNSNEYLVNSKYFKLYKHERKDHYPSWF